MGGTQPPRLLFASSHLLLSSILMVAIRDLCLLLAFALVCNCIWFFTLSQVLDTGVWREKGGGTKWRRVEEVEERIGSGNGNGNKRIRKKKNWCNNMIWMGSSCLSWIWFWLSVSLLFCDLVPTLSVCYDVKEREAKVMNRTEQYHAACGFSSL